MTALVADTGAVAAAAAALITIVGVALLVCCCCCCCCIWTSCGGRLLDVAVDHLLPSVTG